MDQLELNLEMVDQGIARYRNKVQAARNRGLESEAPYGQRIIRSKLPVFITELEKRFEYHRKNPHAVPFWMPLIWDVEPETIAMLAMKSTIDGICEKRPLVSAAIRICSYIEDEVRMRRLKDEHPEVPTTPQSTWRNTLTVRIAVKPTLLNVTIKAKHEGETSNLGDLGHVRKRYRWVRGC